MVEKILTSIITALLSGLIGYLISYFKSKKAKTTIQEEAIKMLLQNNLTNTYFVYERIGEIPDYVYRNWLNMLKAYEGLDGDDYVHILANKMQNFKIITTGIIK